MELAEYIDKGLVHSLHTSERKSFRACRRRWDWVSRQMYYPRTTPAPLEFGVAFHAAMEKFYEPTTWHQLLEVRLALALVTFKQVCDDQLKKYRILNGEPNQSVFDEYHERTKLGLNMIKHYANNVSRYTDVEFTPVAVEFPFEIAILSPDKEPLWCHCDICWKRYKKYKFAQDDKLADEFTLPEDEQRFRNSMWRGLPVTYGGRLDMLARDNHGRFWIYDWKTTSRILDEDAEASFLLLDDQISSYVWALRSLGVDVQGFVYVEIRKAYPTNPKELSRLYKGRRFSTDKTVLTTPEIYRNFVEENDPQAYYEGLYDEHLEWLKRDGPKFHQRHQVHKNDAEVEAVAHNIWLEAQDIVNDPRVYPQPGRFSCNTCLFKQPCIGKNQGEDYLWTLESMFEKRQRHYYETEEPSTE